MGCFSGNTQEASADLLKIRADNARKEGRRKKAARVAGGFFATWIQIKKRFCC
jgi:hypothetical protein